LKIKTGKRMKEGMMGGGKRRKKGNWGVLLVEKYNDPGRR
jgi:hypothetical protein